MFLKFKKAQIRKYPYMIFIFHKFLLGTSVYYHIMNSVVGVFSSI